jgi:nidogen (entactin)
MFLGIDTYTKESRIIADKLAYPFGLAITNDHFYWSDWTTKKIESIDIDGNRKTGIQAPLFSSHKMYGITAVTDRCPIYFSSCNVNNGDCPPNRICLLNPMSLSGKTCKCINHADCNINDIDI